MTLPYPDSPEIKENIANSVERIKDNLDYLDGLIGSGNVGLMICNSIHLSAKTSTSQDITGIGFEPKGMIVFATYDAQEQNSYGAATVSSVSTSVDCHCVGQDNLYQGINSSTHFCKLYQGVGTYIAGSVKFFSSNGVAIQWSCGGVPTADNVGNLMYIFFG